MGAGYNLEWLDSLITVSLNPAKSDLNAFLPEQISYLKSRIEEEKTSHQSFLNNKVFSLLEEKKIRLLINQYHSALIILLDKTLAYGKNIPFNNIALKELENELITCLNDLLFFIEVRYSNYLSLDERIPVTYSLIEKKKIRRRLDKLKPNLEPYADKEVAAIVWENLYSFTDKTNLDNSLTFQEFQYKKELLEELEALTAFAGGSLEFIDLDELLIYMNFNSKSYISYFTRRIWERINTFKNFADKMDALLFHFKEFNQMRRKPGLILNPQHRDLKSEVNNWFTQEIRYLEKKQNLAHVPTNDEEDPTDAKTLSFQKEQLKILSTLTVDQMALLIRSANDLNIIVAKSLNTVFKSIVPHLSTQHQENISWDSMRSKSYNAESRDKEIVIQTLKQMIKKVEEY